MSTGKLLTIGELLSIAGNLEWEKLSTDQREQLAKNLGSLVTRVHGGKVADVVLDASGKPGVTIEWAPDIPDDGGIYAGYHTEVGINEWQARSFGGGYKDPDAFEKQPDKVCYVPDECDRVYTGKDFMEIARGSKVLSNRLFSLCDWQHPETVLEELERDEGVLTNKNIPVSSEWDF